MTTLIGKVVLNRFRVDNFVGSGGMSDVYRVWDLERNVPLAMKVLQLDLADDPSAMKRFQREARALEKLAHPHIVPFYGVFQAADLTFLVEQFVDGSTLRQIMSQRQGQPLPIHETLIYLKALCASLGYAHENGVVHCDVKPGNVMIDWSGNIFLTDFGVARHAESTTTTVGAAGTPAYMAPEQIRGEPVTAETDIYALGVMLFEMLTGRRPFIGTDQGSESSGSSAAERVRFEHLSVAPPDLRGFNPEIPEQLANVVLHAMEKEPGKRYHSTSELLDAVCDASGIALSAVPDRIVPPKHLKEEVKPLPEAGFWAGLRHVPVWLLLVGGAIFVGLTLCVGVVVAAGVPAVIAFLASPTLTPTNTSTPTFTIPPTLTPNPTSTPTTFPTFTGMPLPPPADSNPPTFTPEPTDTPTPESFTFFVKNNRGNKIQVWIDGIYLGVLWPGQMVNASVSSWGKHTFKWCNYEMPKKQCKTESFQVEHSREVIPLN